MELDKYIIIKRKISIDSILILVGLFIISFACFYGILNMGIETNMELLIAGVLFGILFILLFPYFTFKRPYYKVTSEGIYEKIPKGFTYGKEKFFSWNEIIEEINQDLVDEDEKVILCDEFLENYINILKNRVNGK